MPYCGPPVNNNIKTLLPLKNNQFSIPSWFGGRTVHYVHKARIAIRHACDLLGIKEGTETLAPSYNCGSEIDPLIKSGTSIVPYRIDKHAKIDFSDMFSRITKKTKLIYITHYFGFPQDLEEIKKICLDRHIFIIEDCALSLFTNVNKAPIGTLGNLAIFNFPKTLPVPDGGALLINDTNLDNTDWYTTSPSYSDIFRAMLPLAKATFLKRTSHVAHLKRFITNKPKLKLRTYFIDHHSVSYPELPNSYYYDEQISNKGISAISQWLLSSFDYMSIKNIRRKNYLLMLSLLSGKDFIKPLFPSLPEDVCPLCFPVIIENCDRDELCLNLNSAAIQTPPWWAGFHRALEWNNYPEACYLKNNLIVLPIHQDLGPKEVHYIAEILLDNLPKYL